MSSDDESQSKAQFNLQSKGHNNQKMYRHAKRC